MKSLNRAAVLGHVTRDAELKVTASGKPVCTFGLATNRVWKDAAGERQSVPEYHNIVCWGALAEFAGHHIKKGKPLYAEGHLKTRHWENPAGVKMSRTEIVADNLILVGNREGVTVPEPEPEVVEAGEEELAHEPEAEAVVA